jgi:hypothetical protein
MEMGTCPCKTATSIIGNNRLIKLKLKAVRCGIWFRTLNTIERALINLTIKVVNHVQSCTLAEILSSIIAKLEDAFESSRIVQALKEVGFPLAHKLSLLAQKWRNESARDWMYDVSFAKFLAIMHMNHPAAFQ